ncbi:MAG TPA: MazG-like family protein [Phycisphaerae bacterium]|nr:MazG-like family protein [Phycisphaerae bacterium]
MPTDPTPTPSDHTATLESLKQLMRDFITERHWEKYHTPKNLAAAAAVEAAELLELFQWLTPEESAHKPIHDQRFRQAVGEEIADVLMYLISLANSLDLDVASTISAKMTKNRLKYPPERFHGHYERPLD